jgi:hypothetical protein
MENESVLEIVRFREGRPTDIPAVAIIEKISYPEDEAVSKSSSSTSITRRLAVCQL